MRSRIGMLARLALVLLVLPAPFSACSDSTGSGGVNVEGGWVTTYVFEGETHEMFLGLNDDDGEISGEYSVTTSRSTSSEPLRGVRNGRSLVIINNFTGFVLFEGTVVSETRIDATLGPDGPSPLAVVFTREF